MLPKSAAKDVRVAHLVISIFTVYAKSGNILVSAHKDIVILSSTSHQSLFVRRGSLIVVVAGSFVSLSFSGMAKSKNFEKVVSVSTAANRAILLT